MFSGNSDSGIEDAPISQIQNSIWSISNITFDDNIFGKVYSGKESLILLCEVRMAKRAKIQVTQETTS
jgi:hypothetical protein